MNVIEALENKIQQLKDWEWEAKEARDYTACLQLYGAIIYFKQFLEELKENERAFKKSTRVCTNRS